jgi:putative hydrolase of the HAD superfamily
MDRALAAVGLPADAVADLVPDLVRVFTGHRPERLTPYDGVREALTRLAAAVPVAVITDGIPALQHAKVLALGLDDLVTAVVVSDELGGRHLRKPDPAPFRRALELLGQPASHVVHVGDRPEKDVRGATAVGMRAVRVRTGEYAALPDGPDRPWRTAATFPEAADLCLTGAGTTGAAVRL